MKVLITGAASGIGFDLALELAKRGHTVYITVHTKSQLEQVQEKIKEMGLNVLCFKMDIRKKEDRKLIDTLNIDCLVNHAGIGNGGSLLYMDIGVLKDNYETNIFASFSLLQEFYQMKREKGEKARIFITSSIASMLPIPFLGCYTSSKAAISMLAFTLKEELKYLKDHDITISLIEPGAYKTGFNQVIIDNKNKFLKKNNKIYEHKDSINKIQRNMFTLIEKTCTKGLVKKVVREIESESPSFKIRTPITQGIFAKLFLLFYR